MTRHRIRRYVDDLRFWLVVAFVVLAAAYVALIVTYEHSNRALATAAQDRAVHIAEVRANAQAQYSQCLRSRPQLAKVDDFVRGVRIAQGLLLVNAVETHRVTPPGTSSYRVQAQNIARLRRSVALVSGVAFPVPSRRECVNLRDGILKRDVAT